MYKTHYAVTTEAVVSSVFISDCCRLFSPLHESRNWQFEGNFVVIRAQMNSDYGLNQPQFRLCTST